MSLLNFQVFYSSAAVGAVGMSAAAALTVLGFKYPLISLSTWLIFLPVTLTLLGVIILYCNTTVLRTVRRQIKQQFTMSAPARYSFSEDGSTGVSTITNNTNLECCNSCDVDLDVPHSPTCGKYFIFDRNTN